MKVKQMTKNLACVYLRREVAAQDVFSKSVTLNSRKTSTFIEKVQNKAESLWIDYHLLLQDFQRCVLFEFCRLTSLNAGDFVSQRSSLEEDRFWTWSLRWTLSTSSANEVLGITWPCSCPSCVERCPLRLSTKSSGKTWCFYSVTFSQLRSTKLTSFTNEVLGKRLFSTIKLLHTLVVNVSNKMFCKIDK